MIEAGEDLPLVTEALGNGVAVESWPDQLLWPELDSEAAANNLHKTVHLARRALEPESGARAGSSFILTQDQQVMLRAPGELWIDLEAFEQRAADALAGGSVEAVEGALELYSGDLLPEDLYEDWAAARREHARSLYQELLARLTQLYEAAGEYQRAIEWLRIVLASDPTNEETHRQLMRLYAQTGSQHQALRQYRQCCEMLRRELDAEPERATLEIARGYILQGHSLMRIYATLARNRLEAADFHAALGYAEQGLAIEERHGRCLICGVLSIRRRRWRTRRTAM